MWNTAVHSEFLHDHADYGFDISSWSFNFKKIKEARDAYIARLHGIYNSNLEKDHVEKIVSGISISISYLYLYLIYPLLQIGTAKFVGPNTVVVEGKQYTGEHILIATGGHPTWPKWYF